MAASQTAQLSAQYSSIMTGNYCEVAATAIFVFDSIITTGEEIRCFWGRNITGAAIVFWLNKYMTMLFLGWGLATFLKLSDKSCAMSSKSIVVIDCLLFIVLAAFTAIRVYALGRSLNLCAITAVLSLVPLGINFVAFRFGVTGKNIFPFGCITIDSQSIGLTQKFVIIARSCSIAADCLAIGSTWLALGLPHANSRGGILKGSISSALLLDGTVYFLILAVLNSLHLAFTLLSINIDSLQSVSVVTAFTAPLSAILVSRFLLHLQSASLRAVGSIPSSQISSLHLDRSLVFERVVGSLGASITPEDYLKEDYGEGDDVGRADEPTQTSRE
ncbi:hypothetical protein BD309DRAFT_904714 [Dichomitus squalens]|nr:hypothetical protein BD309DRAFT_904714 [Dichomitus squalens]